MAQREVDSGAELIFAVEDQPYGMRQACAGGPFGHHWLIGRRLVDPRASG